MKKLFSVPGWNVRMADKERLIFGIRNCGFYDKNDKYFDINGKQIPPEDSFEDRYNLNDDPWKSQWIEDEGLEEKLIAESVEDIVRESDGSYGKFGYKNRSGEFVIEPQYAYARQFTYGLAAVNLNRTWYWNEEYERCYENHFGYINERGETVIPFAYNDAQPFNKYGVAVVEDRNGSRLIDTEGKVIPGTENLSIQDYYKYKNRFFEFFYPSDDGLNDDPDDYLDDCQNNRLVGIYDTKERRILLEPSIKQFTEWSEDQIEVHTQRYNYYINSKGEKLYPWLLNKGFNIIKRPNKANVTIVATERLTDWNTITTVGYQYGDRFLYGIYSAKEHFLVPMEYDDISELADNIFGCFKDGMVTVMQLEDSDI